MKKIATLLLCICLGLPIVSALGSCGCRHPENKLELKSTTATCTAAVGEPLKLIIGIDGYLSENGIKENADWQYVFNIKLLDNVYTELVPQGELKFVGESDN